jgi:iron complex transport system substrate-binding protein
MIISVLLFGCGDVITDYGNNNLPVIEEIVDATDTKISIKIPPDKIISLSPVITKNLYALGVEDNIVGVTTRCVYPVEARKKEKVGMPNDVDFKKIIYLSPDVVLCTATETPHEIISDLRRIGISVFVMHDCITFEEIENNFQILGKIIGKERMANVILIEAANRVNMVVNRIKHLPPVKVFWEVVDEPLTTIGRNSLGNTIIEVAGGENIVKGSVKFPYYTTLAVLRNNPDVIILSGVPEEEVYRWKQIKSLKATQENRIYTVDPSFVLPSTPLEFAEAVEKVARLLHPEIEKEDNKI